MATLAIHGHFYQPDRRDPASGTVPPDTSAAPDHDWNARIDRECYRGNAAAGNYARISHNFGPTLLLWMRKADPATYRSVIEQGRSGNAIAQGFHHAILPLSLDVDRRTEIRWGIADYILRYGRPPVGFWLPETAVDQATLLDLATEGIRFVILAPWQAAVAVDSRRAYRVDLPDGRHIIAIFYDAELSARVSFEDRATENADRFVRDYIGPRAADLPGRDEPLLVIATDGELYGHHKRFRDQFLAAIPAACASAGMRLRSLPDVVAGLDPATLPIARIADGSSWSCHHGVARWAGPCPCCPDGEWKGQLRAALNRLAIRIDDESRPAFAAEGLSLDRARDGYVAVASGFRDRTEHGRTLVGSRTGSPGVVARIGDLLEAQRSRLAMFSSCAWFWGEPSRVEAGLVLADAGDAIARVRAQTGMDLEPDFVDALAPIRSGQTGETGPELYTRAVALGRRRAA